MLEPVSRRVLSDDVYERIKELLFDGHVESGERLVIDQLAIRLGVSPTPIREALARLESDRLVVKEAHRGYSVAPVLDANSLLKLYEMRLIVEPAAAKIAAECATLSDLEVIRTTVARMQRTTNGARYEEIQAFADADASFHLAIGQASHNPFLDETITRLRAHQQTARLFARRGAPNREETLRCHEAIAQAIEERDGKTAASEMRAHLLQARMHIFNMLNPDPGPDDETDD